MSQVKLECSHLAAGYGNGEVLKDINLTLEEGEMAALIGSNGTGKSTLIKCISGLLPLIRGTMHICGKRHDSLKSKERARLVAVVPQSYHVDYDFTVEDIILMGRNPYLSFRKREGQEDYDIVREAMEVTCTEQFRGRLYNELSGGERQRVILARAIAQQPEIILLDEPTAALDLHHQIEVMELIERLNREDHVTVLAVLHDINMAARFCGRMILLQDGIIKADGTPSEVMTRQNMSQLYHMKLMIRENPLFDRPEVVPIRVMNEKTEENPVHIHVICGTGGAVRVIEELDARGYRVTAGVINTESSDCEICRSLNLERVEIPPFTPVSVKEQEKKLAMMKDAEIILVADIPFGKENLPNLDGLEYLNGQIFFHKNVLNKDYTNGALTRRLKEIEAKKQICYFNDYDEFLNILAGSLYSDE